MKKLIVISLFICLSKLISAQNYPVQANIQVNPPYSLYLSDYMEVGNSKLLVNIFLKDVTQPSLDVRLRFSISNGTIELRTKESYMPPPVSIFGGSMRQLSGAELSDYFHPDNLEFINIDKNQFLNNGGKLPEGAYQFQVEVIEYRRQVLISNTGMTVAFLMLNEPPMWISPAEGTTTNVMIEATFPQYIQFRWLPLHTSSPNSFFTTTYQFTLVEVDEGRSPAQCLAAPAPTALLFQTTVSEPQFIYGAEQELLTPGSVYAAQVRAIDESGRDLFKNDGYTSIIHFTYGQECKPPLNHAHKVSSAYETKVYMQKLPEHTGIAVKYYKPGPNPNYYHSKSNYDSTLISGLKPSTTYEYQVKAMCGDIGSEYLTVDSFTTAEISEEDTMLYSCIDTVNVPPINDTNPIDSLSVGDTITMAGYEAILTKLEKKDDAYAGKCYIKAGNFNIKIYGEFEEIKINSRKQLMEGRVNIVSSEVFVLSDAQREKLLGILDDIDDVFNQINNYLDQAEKIIEKTQEIINSAQSLMNSEALPDDAKSYLTTGKELIEEGKEKIANGDESGGKSLIEKGKSVLKATINAVTSGSLSDIQNIGLGDLKDVIKRMADEIMQFNVGELDIKNLSVETLKDEANSFIQQLNERDEIDLSGISGDGSEAAIVIQLDPETNQQLNVTEAVLQELKQIPELGPFVEKIERIYEIQKQIAFIQFIIDNITDFKEPDVLKQLARDIKKDAKKLGLNIIKILLGGGDSEDIDEYVKEYLMKKLEEMHEKEKEEANND